MHICSIQACWCLLLKIEQLIVPFLIDTGASVNVLASSVYSQLQQPPAICQAGSLQITGVGGNPVQVVGDLQLDVGVGEEKIPTHMVVANIAKIQGILGIPFLRENESVIDISKEVMTCRGQEWKLCYLPSMSEIHVICGELPPGETVQVPVEVASKGTHWVPCPEVLDALGVMALNDEITDGFGEKQIKLKNLGDQTVRFCQHLGVGITYQETPKELSTPNDTAPRDSGVESPTEPDVLHELILKTQSRVEEKHKAEVRELIT